VTSCGIRTQHAFRETPPPPINTTKRAVVAFVFVCLWRLQCCPASGGMMCTVYNIRCTIYGVQCPVYNVQCTMYSVQCTVFNVRCSMYGVQYNVRCTVQCTVYSTMYRVQYNVQSSPSPSPPTLHNRLLLALQPTSLVQSQRAAAAQHSVNNDER
jgi:hypothetical protein